MSEYLATVNFKYFNDFFGDITFPYAIRGKYIKFADSSISNLIIIKKSKTDSFTFEYIAGDSFRIDNIRTKVMTDKEHIAKITKLLENTDEFFYDIEKKMCIYDIQNKKALTYWSPFPPYVKENEIRLATYRDTDGTEKLAKVVNKANLFALINFVNRTFYACIKPEKYNKSGLDFLWKLVCAYSNFPDTKESHVNLEDYITPNKNSEIITPNLCSNLYDLLATRKDGDTILLTEIIEGGIPKADAMDVIIDINLEGFKDLVKEALISNGKLVFVCKYNEPHRFKKLADLLILNENDLDFVVEDSDVIDLDIFKDDDDDLNYGYTGGMF